MPSKTPAKKKATTPAPRRGRVAGSITEQIDRLEIGQCISQCHRFDLFDDYEFGIDAAIKTTAVAMRSTLQSYVQRVMADGDGLDMREYRTESGNFVTDDKTAIMLVVALSRTS